MSRQGLSAMSQGLDRMPLTITDLKQFIYCPRILYLTYVMPVPRPTTAKMGFGKAEHLELDRLEKRRKLKRYGLEEGIRVFHAHLVSERLGLEGKLDLHIERERECYPIEFKHSTAIHFNHKVQLAGYAVLLEEEMKKPVRTGFVYLIPKSEIVPVPITPELRDYVHDTIQAIRHAIAKAAWPRPTAQRHRCRECEYRRYCQDVAI
ncbi:MAG: CRISPR-associated protein Cas4 [Desulfitobacteriaceae bacterium]